MKTLIWLLHSVAILFRSKIIALALMVVIGSVDVHPVVELKSMVKEAINGRHTY